MKRYHNTFVNDRTAGGTFVRISGAPAARIINNLFIGMGTRINGTATQTSKLGTDKPGFVNPDGPGPSGLAPQRARRRASQASRAAMQAWASPDWGAMS